MFLSEFDIQHVNRKAIKGQDVIDHLVDAPLVTNHPLIMEFLDEHLCMIEEQPSWKIYVDRS